MTVMIVVAIIVSQMKSLETMHLENQVKWYALIQWQPYQYFCCGMIFQNVQECRDALAKYAIMKGLQIHYIKNDQVRVRAECMEKCPWKFLASKNSHNNDFVVKTYVPNHKGYRKNTNPMATSKSLSKLLKDRLLTTPFIKYRDLKNLCKTELKLKISLTQARNIRKNVVADLLGSYTEEYKRLHDYVQEINSRNPGTTCVVKASKVEGGDINHFRCFYVCFVACKKGWTEGCRNIICLDGCFLKGVCKGQLLCAVGRDGNNQMFPIAWEVASVENKENWGWFLNLLKYDLTIGDGAELTIISDMQKGLDSAINEHLPEVEHRMCARHVYAAWAKKWKGEERKIAFWKCARSTFENDLKSQLREMNLLGNGILEDFMQYNVESFSKAYFRTTPKCDYVDNNMAETFNGWILDARCKPIISMLEDIRVQVMRRLYAKRKFCTTWICVVGPRPMQKLERNKELSFKWQMVWNGDEGYEVSNVYDQDNRHIVNLKSSSCTCREWELTGIPCQHAVCVLHSEGLEPENFVAHWYIESTYLKANQFMIQPVRGKILWAETGKEEIAPPAHRKLPGRPKVRRKKDKNEIQKAGKLSRKGRIMTCKICKQPGHNIRRCPQKMNMVLLLSPFYNKVLS
ncbi:uncharacterized protein LOC121766685 [Salvia splendens]|uniref:uncharacterized protein LOC121766685 n=1 Tax=Salvia splendens TaxID=180675 RepID=UPI001C26BCEB|nr:uncharacterized protein LOC121766685 [Salvia splendens]